MIVQVVWKVYKKTIGGRAFLPPYGRTNKVNLILGKIKKKYVTELFCLRVSDALRR